VEEYWKSDHFDRPLKRFHRYQRNEKGLPFEELIVDSAGNHISLTRYSYQYYTD
jgi:hypothetical protein